MKSVNEKKVRKRAKIRNRYNQAPNLTQDTNGKVTLIRRHILGLYCLAFPHQNDIMFASADPDPHCLPLYHSISIRKNRWNPTTGPLDSHTCSEISFTGSMRGSRKFCQSKGPNLIPFLASS